MAEPLEVDVVYNLDEAIRALADLEQRARNGATITAGVSIDPAELDRALKAASASPKPIKVPVEISDSDKALSLQRRLDSASDSATLLARSLGADSEAFTALARTDLTGLAKQAQNVTDRVTLLRQEAAKAGVELSAISTKTDGAGNVTSLTARATSVGGTQQVKINADTGELSVLGQVLDDVDKKAVTAHGSTSTLGGAIANLGQDALASTPGVGQYGAQLTALGPAGIAAGVALAGAAAAFITVQTALASSLQFEGLADKISAETGKVDLGPLRGQFVGLLQTSDEAAATLATTLASASRFLSDALPTGQVSAIADQLATVKGTFGGDAEAILRSAQKLGVGAGDTSNFIDLLTKRAAESGVQVNTLAQSINSAAPTLSTLGFNPAQIVDLTANLDQAGISIDELLPGLNKLASGAASAGVDPAVEFRRFADELANTTDQTQALALATDAFGSRGAQRLLSALQSGQISLTDFGSSLSDAAGFVGDLDAAARTPATALDKLRNSFLAAFAGDSSDNATRLADSIERLTPIAETVGGGLANLATNTAIAVGEIANFAGGITDFWEGLPGPVRAFITGGAKVAANVAVPGITQAASAFTDLSSESERTASGLSIVSDTLRGALSSVSAAGAEVRGSLTGASDGVISLTGAGYALNTVLAASGQSLETIAGLQRDLSASSADAGAGLSITSTEAAAVRDALTSTLSPGAAVQVIMANIGATGPQAAALLSVFTAQLSATRTALAGIAPSGSEAVAALTAATKASSSGDTKGIDAQIKAQRAATKATTGALDDRARAIRAAQELRNQAFEDEDRGIQGQIEALRAQKSALQSLSAAERQRLEERRGILNQSAAAEAGAVDRQAAARKQSLEGELARLTAAAPSPDGDARRSLILDQLAALPAQTEALRAQAAAGTVSAQKELDELTKKLTDDTASQALDTSIKALDKRRDAVKEQRTAADREAKTALTSVDEQRRAVQAAAETALADLDGLKDRIQATATGLIQAAIPDLGASLSTLGDELGTQLGDLATLVTLRSRGFDDAVASVFSSGFSKEQQQAFIRELAGASDETLAVLEAQAEQVRALQGDQTAFTNGPGVALFGPTTNEVLRRRGATDGSTYATFFRLALEGNPDPEGLIGGVTAGTPAVAATAGGQAGGAFGDGFTNVPPIDSSAVLAGIGATVPAATTAGTTAGTSFLDAYTAAARLGGNPDPEGFAALGADTSAAATVAGTGAGSAFSDAYAAAARLGGNPDPEGFAALGADTSTSASTAGTAAGAAFVDAYAVAARLGENPDPEGFAALGTEAAISATTAGTTAGTAFATGRNTAIAAAGASDAVVTPLLALLPDVTSAGTDAGAAHKTALEASIVADPTVITAPLDVADIVARLGDEAGRRFKATIEQSGEPDGAGVVNAGLALAPGAAGSWGRLSGQAWLSQFRTWGTVDFQGLVGGTEGATLAAQNAGQAAGAAFAAGVGNNAQLGTALGSVQVAQAFNPAISLAVDLGARTGTAWVQGLNFALDVGKATLATGATLNVEAIVVAAKQRLGIASPSRVAAEIGGHWNAGLIQGLDAGQPNVLSAVGRQAGALADLAGSGRLDLSGTVAQKLDLSGTVAQAVQLAIDAPAAPKVGARIDRDQFDRLARLLAPVGRKRRRLAYADR